MPWAILVTVTRDPKGAKEGNVLRHLDTIIGFLFSLKSLLSTKEYN